MNAGVTFQTGEVVAGKYRVERTLGVGGMGVVVAARHVELGRLVALKFMRADALDKGGAERFVREARIAASLDSEHVAQVMDVGRTERGDPYLVMELLSGRDLSLVVASGPQRPENAVGWILEACEGLACAHARGLVHRDIKPANLFLASRPDGRTVLKILDFGLAKTFAGDEAALTASGRVLGSPQYMAPEQLLARPLDATVDVWALGVCLFELLAGVVPFDAPTVPAVCSAILKEEPRDLAALRPDLDPGLVGVVATCLRKKPSERFPSVAALAAALAPFAPNSGVDPERVARLLAAPSPAAESPWLGAGVDAPTRIVASYDSDGEPPRSRGRLVAVAAGAAIAVAAVASVAVLASSKDRGAGRAVPPVASVVAEDARGEDAGQAPSAAPSAPPAPPASSPALPPRRGHGTHVRPPHPRPTATSTNPMKRF
jgi:serine/threonine protein kinase